MFVIKYGRQYKSYTVSKSLRIHLTLGMSCSNSHTMLFSSVKSWNAAVKLPHIVVKSFSHVLNDP